MVQNNDPEIKTAILRERIEGLTQQLARQQKLIMDSEKMTTDEVFRIKDKCKKYVTDRKRCITQLDKLTQLNPCSIL